jgi:formate dehydrogenase subunit gamma
MGRLRCFAPRLAKGLALDFDAAVAEEIIAGHLGLEGPALPILHALQAAFGCVPKAAIPLIAKALNRSRAEIHGVVSFYHDFREVPAGKTVVKVCRAEACQAMGGRETASFLLGSLGIGWGETTKDGQVTIEPVYCLGLCAVAPAALVNGKPFGRLDGMALIEAVSGEAGV